MGTQVRDPQLDKMSMESDYSQKELVKMYGRYISNPKMEFFKSLGLGVIQTKREGIRIFTQAGKRKKDPSMELIDCRTSGGVFNLGHRHPAILAAMTEAMNLGLDIGDHHMLSEQRALLARDLADLLPGDISKTQMCVGGGEAIDLALKMARAFTKRRKIISITQAYHGVTGLALAACNSRFKSPFLWDLPDFFQVPFGDLDAMNQAIDENTAAVILETIPATGGILIPPQGYLSSIRKRCDEMGVMLIADEVQTGLGRTGQLWGVYGGIYPEEMVVPDLIVLAKGMSAGIYPLATCSYRPYLEEIFMEDPFLHISTTGGSEIGCYVTRKMLQMVSNPAFLENVRQRGEQFKQGLNSIAESRSDIVADVRGRGLMWGVEFITDRYGIGYTLAMIEHGIFADYCGNNEKTIKLMPPLIVTASEINEIVTKLAIAIKKLPVKSGGISS